MIKRTILSFFLISCFMIFAPTLKGWTSTRLTWSASNSVLPVMTVDKMKNLYVFYADETPGNYEIFFKKSTDTGTTWATKRLTWNIGTSQAPSVAIDTNDNIHLVWMDDTPGNDEIFYRKSIDGGTTWSTRRLTTNPDFSYLPVITTDSNDYIHVVWQDFTPGNWEIFYAMSTDGGNTWTSKRLTWNQGVSVTPAITTDSNDVIHLVWGDDSVGNSEIYYRKSTDFGTTWSPTKRMTWNPGISRLPRIATDLSDHIHVVWDDDSFGNIEIVHKRSTDGGVTWTAKRLTWNSGGSQAPKIAAGFKNILHVVWSDNSPGNTEVFYKTSADLGVTWTTERLTWNGGESMLPFVFTHTTEIILPAKISFAAYRVHVLWGDDTPGNFEIFHKYK